MDRGHKMTDDLLAELERRVKAEYKTAHLDMERKLNNYLQKFAAEDAVQRRKLKAGEITAKEYRDWCIRKTAIGDRWQAMRDTLAEDMHNANQIALSISKGYRADVYALNRNYAVYQIEHDAKIDLNYTLYDRHTAQRLLEKQQKMLPAPRGKTARMLKENPDLVWNKQHLQSAVLQGILQGEKITDIAGRLRGVTDMNLSASIRNARTMVTGAQNAGRVDGYKYAQDKGVDLQKEWMATLDGRTRHSHRLLHGERVGIDERFSNGCKYPGDPDGEPATVYNCRCTLIGQIKGFETDRIESSPKMGEMTFEEWQAEKRKPEAQPAPKPKLPPVDLGTVLTQSLGSDAAEYAALVEANPDVQKTYDLYAKDLRGCEKHPRGGDYIASRINWSEAGGGRHKYATLAHEYGHYTDDRIRNVFSSAELTHVKETVGKRITFGCLKEMPSQSDEFLTAMRSDRNKIAARRADGLEWARIKRDLLKNNASSGVQDAFDGFWNTQGTGELMWGHGNKYYNRTYNHIKKYGGEKDLQQAFKDLGFDAGSQAKTKTIMRDYETASELWANVQSAKTVGGDELEYMERYFPETCKAWEKLVRGAQ